MIRDRKFILIFMMPGIFGFTVFCVFPFLSTIQIFLKASDGSGYNLHNLTLILQNEVFILALKNTVVFTLVAILSLNILSFLFAYIINTFFKGVVILALLILPLALPTIAVAGIWIDIFSLERIWIGASSRIIVLSLFLWKYIGLNTIIYIAGFKSIPKIYYETAIMDGASKWNRLSRISIPLMSRFIYFGILISVINSFKIFREIYAFYGDYPPKNLYLLHHFMQNNFNKLNHENTISAAYIFILLIVAIMLILFIANKKRGEINID